MVRFWFSATIAFFRVRITSIKSRRDDTQSSGDWSTLYGFQSIATIANGLRSKCRGVSFWRLFGSSFCFFAWCFCPHSVLWDTLVPVFCDEAHFFARRKFNFVPRPVKYRFERLWEKSPQLISYSSETGNYIHVGLSVTGKPWKTLIILICKGTFCSSISLTLSFEAPVAIGRIFL